MGSCNKAVCGSCVCERVKSREGGSDTDSAPVISWCYYHSLVTDGELHILAWHRYIIRYRDTNTPPIYYNQRCRNTPWTLAILAPRIRCIRSHRGQKRGCQHTQKSSSGMSGSTQPSLWPFGPDALLPPTAVALCVQRLDATSRLALRLTSRSARAGVDAVTEKLQVSSAAAVADLAAAAPRFTALRTVEV